MFPRPLGVGSDPWLGAGGAQDDARDQVDRELAALLRDPAAGDDVVVPLGSAPRRTVRITGRLGERSMPATRRRRRRRAHERLGPRPDLVAAWAVALGLLLVLIAVATADAAMAAASLL